MRVKKSIRLYIMILPVILISTFLLCSFTEDAASNIIKISYHTLIKESIQPLYIFNTFRDEYGVPYSISPQFIYDNRGVPSFVPLYNHSSPIIPERNPFLVCETALYYDRELKQGNGSCRQLFLNCSDWLLENMVTYDNYSILEYRYYNPMYNLSPPWRSGLAQGSAASVLIKAYELTKDKKYLNGAKYSLNALSRGIDEGGVTYKDNDGWWYEEYVRENDTQPRVLNGMIYAMVGIYKYYNITKDENAKYLFEKGLVSLKNRLKNYDCGTWTYYDALGYYANRDYHRIHIEQMLFLYNVTRDPIFNNYYNVWKGYDESPLRFFFEFRRQPDELTIAVFTFNFILLFILSAALIFIYHRKCR